MRGGGKAKERGESRAQYPLPTKQGQTEKGANIGGGRPRCAIGKKGPSGGRKKY